MASLLVVAGVRAPWLIVVTGRAAVRDDYMPRAERCRNPSWLGEFAALARDVGVVDVARMHRLVQRPVPVFGYGDGLGRVEEAHPFGVGARGTIVKRAQVRGDARELGALPDRPVRRNDRPCRDVREVLEGADPVGEDAVPGLGDAREAREATREEHARFAIPHRDAPWRCRAAVVEKLQAATRHGEPLPALEDTVRPGHAGAGHEVLAKDARQVLQARLAPLGDQL